MRIFAVVAFALMAITVSIHNATLMFDDLYIVGNTFPRALRANPESSWGLLKYILLNLDIAPREYRLYGLSRLIHFGLWKLFGSDPAPYVAVIAATQVLSGYCIYRLLKRSGADEFQASAAWTVWCFSIFAATSCFHYYSYLILPYQITVFCAVVLRWRALSFLLGAAIALTGEAHLVASCVILALAAGAAAGSDQDRWAKLINAAVPIVAIGAVAIVHRVIWKSLVVEAGATRYVFGIAGPQEVLERLWIFSRSLLPAFTLQVSTVLTFSIAGLVAALVLVVLSGAVRAPVANGSGSNRSAAGLLAIASASFFVLAALSASTGVAAEILPRRYGLVPYTLLVMCGIVFLLSPKVKAVFGVRPAVMALTMTISLWAALQFSVWPTIRKQDNSVWEGVSKLLAAKGPDANILFVSASNLRLLERKQLSNSDINSIPFRAPSPSILESSFHGLWWQVEYAIVVAGASFAAYRWEEVDEENIKLFGNEVNGLPPRVVRKSSMVVLFDTKPVPSDPRTVTAFWDWKLFEEAISRAK